MNITKIILLIFSSIAMLSNMVDAQSFFPADNLFFNTQIYISDFERGVFLDARDGNQPKALAVLLATDSSASEDGYLAMERGIDLFCKKLKSKKSLFTSEEDKLANLFYKVQSSYLKKYQTGQTVDKTIINGTYDCLTASAIYGLVLDKLGYNYRIIETPHHVYVKVLIKKNKEILLETTDRYHGFITDSREIIEREKKYAAQTSGSFVEILRTFDKHTVVDSTLHNEINLLQLSGLQYFNQGVSEYNKGNYKGAFVYIEKAFMFYPSDRVNGLAIMTLQQILARKNPNDKDYKFYSNKYRTYLSLSQYLASAHLVH